MKRDGCTECDRRAEEFCRKYGRRGRGWDLAFPATPEKTGARLLPLED